MRLIFRCAVLLCAMSTLCSGAAPRPNIIFILTDDMGWGDLGVFFQNGRTSTQKFVTPHLDTFASEGMQLRRHYCPAPVCAPSRASLILGVHQGHANIRDNQFDKELADNHTLASVLKQAGYATACIGKWGLQGGSGFPAHPQHRGFDYFFGYISHGEAHRHYPKENGVTYYDGFTNISGQLDKCYSTDLATARAKKWITDKHQTQPDKPFFIYLTYNAPHARLQVPTGAYPAGGGLTGGLQWTGTPGAMINSATGTADSFIHPDYAGTGWPAYAQRHATMIRRLDDSVADLVKLLKDLTIDDNTLIVFTSDNGTHNEGGSGGNYTYNPRFFETFGPFEGIKRDVWEGGIRVPALVRWPSHIPAGGVTESPSQFQDWMPTFAEIAGLPKPSRSDGVSLIPTLTGTGTQKASDIYVEYNFDGTTPNYTEFPNHMNAVRDQMQVTYIGKYKGVRTNVTGHATKFRIYDTAADPAEANDLDGKPGIPTQQQFKDRVLRLRRSGAGVPRPYDAEAVPALTPTGIQQGLRYKSYEETTPWVPDWRTETAASEGTTAFPSPSVRTRAEDIGVSFEGYLKVPADGDYTFTLTTDTGAFVHLHDLQLIDADFGYTAGTERSSGAIRLKAGYHPIRIDYRHAKAETHALSLEWSGPGLSKQAIPAEAFFTGGESQPGQPSATSDNATTIQGAAVTIPVIANDSDGGDPDALMITGLTTPASGTAAIDGVNVVYTPAPGFLGHDTFHYTIRNESGTSTGIVSVSVTFQNAEWWFPLNQLSGFTTREAGGARTATLQGFENETAPWVEGRQLRALRFDGSDDQVLVNGFEGISGANPRTMSAWVRSISATAVDKPIICWGTRATGAKWTFLMTSTGRLRLEAEGGYLVGSSTLNDGQWHHVACTFADDGTPNVTDAKLYVDGTAETPSTSQGVAINTSGPTTVRIGADIQSRYWNGDLSDVRIIPRALTTTEIGGIFQSSMPAGAWKKRYYGGHGISWKEDTDGDGRSALEEYAFGGQPHLAQAAEAPALTDDSSARRIEFLRRPAETCELTYRVQASRDMISWELPVVLLQSTRETVTDEVFERVCYAAENAVTRPTLFYRVQVNLP